MTDFTVQTVSVANGFGPFVKLLSCDSIIAEVTGVCKRLIALAVLEGFGDVDGLDRDGLLEVGDSLGDFDGFEVASGGEIESPGSALKEVSSRGGKL